MMQITLSSEVLKEILEYESEDGRYKKIKEKITDTSRWTINYIMLFEDTQENKFYQTYFSKGATEYQYQEPFEDHDGICHEVHQVEIVKKVWRLVKDYEPVGESN